jgi:hypothetical protein
LKRLAHLITEHTAITQAQISSYNQLSDGHQGGELEFSSDQIVFNPTPLPVVTMTDSSHTISTTHQSSETLEKDSDKLKTSSSSHIVVGLSDDTLETTARSGPNSQQSVENTATMTTTTDTDTTSTSTSTISSQTSSKIHEKPSQGLGDLGLGRLWNCFLLPLRWTIETTDNFFLIYDSIWADAGVLLHDQIYALLPKARCPPVVPLPLIRFIAAEIILALGHLHSLGFVYGLVGIFFFVFLIFLLSFP